MREVVALLAIGLCVAGCADKAAPRREPFAPETTVELRSAPLPGMLGLVARHCWFVTRNIATGERHRWEVWQDAGQCATSWGHVHRDLLHADAGVGGGAYRVEREWRGDEALRLAAALESSPSYPYRDTYRAWPGPNSNTYVAWVLDEAHVGADLPPTAVGKDYTGAVSIGWSPTRTGVELKTLPGGAKLGLADGVEANVLGLTFGVSLLPPSIKLPFGRVGPSR